MPRATTQKPSRWSGPERTVAPNPGSRKGREKIPDSQQPVIRGQRVLPEPTRKEMCVRKGTTEDARAKRLRLPCHVELLFLGQKLGKHLSVDPGVYLQFCTEWGRRGDLVRVKNHEEAYKISHAYCGCRSAGEPADRCAREVGAGMIGKKGQ